MVLRKVLVAAMALGAGWGCTQRQDIVRYLRIKQMSMGDGHPGKRPSRRLAELPESLTAVPVCGPAAPQSRRRPVLGGFINEYEWAA